MVVQEILCYWTIQLKMVKMANIILHEFYLKKSIEMDEVYSGQRSLGQSTWKKCSASFAVRKLQIIPQCNITTYLPGQATHRKIDSNNTSGGEDVWNWNSFIVWCNFKLENCWIVSTEAEEMHILWCSHFT